MYSLKHGVNLSRRACRISLCLLVISFLPCWGQSTPAGDGGHNTYPGMKFGPMGPADRGPPPLEPSNLLLKQDAPTGGAVSQTTSSSESTTEMATKHPIERYKVFNTDFLRVETPFIIGLWIFCASLAKIGKSNVNTQYLHIFLIKYSSIIIRQFLFRI